MIKSKKRNHKRIQIDLFLPELQQGVCVSQYSDYKGSCLLGRDAVQFGTTLPTFRSNLLPPTAAARVQALRICGGQSGAGAGFLRVLRFPLPIFIPPILPPSPSPTIRGWYNSPVSGRSTQKSHRTN
jgi:hypothetical protein